MKTPFSIHPWGSFPPLPYFLHSNPTRRKNANNLFCSQQGILPWLSQKVKSSLSFRYKHVSMLQIFYLRKIHVIIWKASACGAKIKKIPIRKSFFNFTSLSFSFFSSQSHLNSITGMAIKNKVCSASWCRSLWVRCK